MIVKQLMGQQRVFGGPVCRDGAVIHLRPEFPAEDDPRWGPWTQVIVSRRRPDPKPPVPAAWRGTPGRPKLAKALARKGR